MPQSLGDTLIAKGYQQTLPTIRSRGLSISFFNKEGSREVIVVEGPAVKTCFIEQEISAIE